MPRALISAAHTLMVPGQVFQDLREADLTRKIVNKMVPHLGKTGVTFQAVPLDLVLTDRIEWINNTGYSEDTDDILVEIHVNDGGKRGIEGWFSEEANPGNRSQILADYLLKEVCTITGYTNQTAKSELEHELTSLVILNQTNTISVALECLYIDNPEDIAILKDDKKLDDLAKALADSIAKYLKSDLSKKPANAKPKAKPDPVFSPKAPSFGGGLPSFGGFGGGLGGAPAAAAQPSGGSSNLMMDREQRKKMITDTYMKLLGKEPNANELNQNLNVGVSEDQLIKKLAESKEFETMIKDAKDAKELRGKSTQSEAEIAKLQSENNDLKAINANLNRLLQHKNMTIAKMQQEMVNRGVLKPGEFFDLGSTTPPQR